ncbi:MAG: carboxypeptidase-like regulatory domain-containing protein [Brumimicrobium sp.]
MACTKFGMNITVKGQVLNPLDGEPFKGITIVLFKQNLKTIKTTITDANGHFEINAARIGEILIRADNTNYQENYNLGFDYKGKYHYSLKVDKGEVMHVDYHLVPYGELRMHVQNQNCQGSTDSLNIFFDGSSVLSLSGNQDANNHIGNILYAPITGCWDNIGDGFKTQMGDRYYHWTVTRSGVSQTFYDTIFVQPNQITTLNVFY